MRLSPEDRAALWTLIESLDADGYLADTLADIAERLSDASDPLDREELLERLQCALMWLQSLDPAGVGARDLAECLTLQLRAGLAVPARALAMRFAAGHLDLLAKREFKKLTAATGADETQLREARELIVALRPQAGPGVRPQRIDGGRARRDRAAGRPRVEGAAQPRRDAQAAHQRPLRAGDPWRAAAQRHRSRLERATAGGALVRQEHPAALRHDRAGVAGHRRTAEGLLHAWRDRDEAAGAARDRRRARPARVDHLARHHRQVHVHAVSARSS